MNKPDHSEPELHLLLEDFGKSRPAPAKGTLPPVEGLQLRLLIEDYPEKTAEFLREFSGVAHPGTAVSDVPPPRLLIEEFDPISRYREHNAGRPPVVLPPMEGPEPDFLVHWGSDVAHSRRREARAASAAVHLALILFLILQPRFDPPDTLELEVPQDYTQVVVIAPSAEELAALTRRPETAKQSGETRVFRGETRRADPVPSALTPLTAPVPEIKPAPPTPTQPIVPEQIKPEPPSPLAEDRAKAAAKTPDKPTAQSPNPDDFRPGRRLAQTRDPRELPVPPKKPAPAQLVLEDPKATMPSQQGAVQLGELGINRRPGEVIESAIEQMVQQGGGRQAVGDGVGAGMQGGYVPPSAGNIGSGLELLSDPKGVDFRPYLTQILNSVRRNWYAVIPESARLGMERGRVAIQFSVARTGDVPKLVIASSSQSQPLDRAAVAGISASLPFPPLPAEFTGEEVRLQFVFLYNIKR